MPISPDTVPTHGESPWSGKLNSVLVAIIEFVNNLEDLVINGAQAVHTHVISEITGLQTALNGKAASIHTHTVSQLTDATTLGRNITKAATATDARTLVGAIGSSDGGWTDIRKAATVSALPAPSSVGPTVAYIVLAP